MDQKLYINAHGLFGSDFIYGVEDSLFLQGPKWDDIGQRFYQRRKVKDLLPDTKVVDDKGEPLIVYHGTDRVFNMFDRKYWSSGAGGDLWGKGFYFSQSPKVSGGAVDKDGNVISGGYARTGDVNYQQPDDSFKEKLADAIIKKGYYFKIGRAHV